MTKTKVIDSKFVQFKGSLRPYLTVDGYTRRCGAPTNYMVKINDSNRWYRVHTYCVSNSGTLFIKTKASKFTVISNPEEVQLPRIGLPF
jgi:hypothetical protein